MTTKTHFALTGSAFSSLKVKAVRLNTSGSNNPGTRIGANSQKNFGVGTFADASLNVSNANGAAETASRIDIEFTVSGEPGHWWMYAKSLENHKVGSTYSNYPFYRQMYTPASPQGAGWTR